MSSIMMLKRVVLVVFILVVSSSASMGISPMDNMGGNTIYVDDIPGEGPDNPPEDFTSIQDAIDAASDGDTVFVYNGTYYEHVIVYKAILLVGQDRNSTTIDGKGNENTVKIVGENVTMDGFKVTNGRNRGLYIKSNNIWIMDNIISGCQNEGVWIEYSSHIYFERNIVIDNYANGILLYYNINHSIFHNNHISNNGIGINVAGSFHNFIEGNIIINNQYGILLAGYSSNNTFSDNVIRSNNCGIESHITTGSNSFFRNNISKCVESGVVLEYSPGNILEENTITDAGEKGIVLGHSDENIIRNNHICGTDEFSCVLYYSDSNVIADNVIEDNEGFGMICHSSSENNIYGNMIQHNQGDGLHLEVYSLNNVISSNIISFNQGVGLCVWYSSNNSIEENTFFFNRLNANFTHCTNTWNGNFWNRPRLLPYLIFGEKGSKPLFEVDWHPRVLPVTGGG